MLPNIQIFECRHIDACAGECPLGARCCSAHGLEELRVRAAIEQGVLPDTYKTQRCHEFDAKGACPTGTPPASARMAVEAL